VMSFIEDACGEVPAPPSGLGWAQLACFYLSTAVELYSAQVVSRVEDGGFAYDPDDDCGEDPDGWED
jgi:hypothetical protein